MSAWLNQNQSDEDPGHALMHVSGQTFVTDRSGALYWPDENTLIVADLHLEKGSSFARFRSHLPPYDTAATLAQLKRAVQFHQPARVIALGDSVHDRGAWERLSVDARTTLKQLFGQVDDWVWIAGNHDPHPPTGVPGRSAQELTIGDVALRHEPGGPLGTQQLEIAGHLHPAARVLGKGGSARRPAFATDGARLVLPAFGAYAGGLCLSSAPFKALFAPGKLNAWVCGRTRIFTVPGRNIAGWR